MEIRNGGKPQIDLYNRYIVADIFQLQQKLLDNNGRFNANKEEYLELMKKVNSFFPFSHNLGSYSCDPVENVLLSGDMLDSQSILNFNND